MTRLALLVFAGAAAISAQQPRGPALSTDARIAAIERRMKMATPDAGLRNELAGAYLQKMRETADGSYLERASLIIHAILEADPSNYDARRRQIEIELQRHHFREVVTLSGRLTEERPKDPAVRGMLGDAAMEMGDYDRAADAYQTMVDLLPNLASYNRVAFYRFVTGDAEGAIEIMRRAIQSGSHEPENVAWCLADMGRMMLKTGRLDDAGQAFRQAISLFPGYHPALAGLGRVHAARGQYGDAIKLLLEAQAKVPFPEYTGLLARLYRKTGKPELAKRQIALLDISERLDRAAGESANRNLSLALSDLGHRIDRALELARAELEIRRDVYTYDALAWALFRNGKFAEAGTAIENALGQNSPEPAFHDHAAQIFEALGRTDEAAQHRNRSRADYW